MDTNCEIEKSSLDLPTPPNLFSILAGRTNSKGPMVVWAGRQVVELARTRLFGTMKSDDQEEPHVEGEEEALRREIDVCEAGVRCEP